MHVRFFVGELNLDVLSAEDNKLEHLRTWLDRLAAISRANAVLCTERAHCKRQARGIMDKKMFELWKTKNQSCNLSRPASEDQKKLKGKKF
jgi:hypothetical protein